MLDKSKIVALKGKTAKPKQMTVRIQITLANGITPIAQIPLEQIVPIPANGEAVSFEVTLDANLLYPMLEAALGPKNTKAKLWTPGG